MLLKAIDGSEFELAVVGYEFPQATDERDDWLVLSVRIKIGLETGTSLSIETSKLSIAQGDGEVKELVFSWMPPTQSAGTTVKWSFQATIYYSADPNGTFTAGNSKTGSFATVR